MPRSLQKPLMVFDGDCHFCRRWIERWRETTLDRVDYQSSQEVGADFPEIPRESFEREVKLIEPDGRVLGGAEAVFRSLNHAARPGLLALLAWWMYRQLPGFAPATEWAYHLVARHRTLASTLTRWFWGNDVTRPTYRTAQAWFLRVLGVIFFVAFLSLRVQIDGLIGEKGILPFAPFLDAVRHEFGAARGWHLLPTLCWIIGGGDGALHFLCDGGMVLAALLIAGIAPALCLFLLWVFYLSLFSAGQMFLGFQWDILLLETGFLSIFFAPLRAWPRRGFPSSPPPLGLFMLRWLLFRLMLMSGVVKLASGDAAWLGLSALRYHYETQPLPTWIGWYFHQAPSWFQAVSSVFLFVVELVAPFFIFGPRRVRMTGFVLLVLLQILIAATGNYGFFNLLTVALCLLLLDDKQWSRWLAIPPPVSPVPAARRWPKWILVPLTAVFVFFGSLLLWNAFTPIPLPAAYAAIEPFGTINGYGLFRVMTRERPEIVVEGSRDGEHWLPYAFKSPPGDPARAPAFVAPYMPRLDWQMWFAALGDFRQNRPLVVGFSRRLLEGSPAVLGLLAANPFPDAPPRYVRATLYDYHFTDLAEYRRTGAWWRREERGPYCPVLSLSR